MSTPAPCPDELRLRPATLADAEVLAYQRRAMFAATGLLDPAEAEALEAAVGRYIRTALPAGTFRAWLIEHGSTVVAGGGLQLRTLMPRPGYVRGEPEGLIVSMWTEPAYRRRGLGRRVLEAMLAWARQQGVRRLTLHASADGRPLYARYGFKGTNEMRLELPAPPGEPAGELEPVRGSRARRSGYDSTRTKSRSPGA